MSGRRGGIAILDDDELKLMRRAGLVVARGLRDMIAAAVPGGTTREVDAVGAEAIARAGAVSSFLGYAPGGMTPFPAVSCQSVNDEVVHGIPSDRVLAPGDLLSIDFGASLGGYHGDAARSTTIGEAAPAVAKLNADTEAALWAGIAAVRPRGTIGDISAAVERSLRRSGRYGILRGYCGHGIGRNMHQDPDIPNFGPPGRGPKILPGMCLAIEPMTTLGAYRTKVLDDGWTVATADGSTGCHWENTVVLTKNGLWVLTEEDGGEAALARLGLKFGPMAD